MSLYIVKFCKVRLAFFLVVSYSSRSMRVKKDKAYVVVSLDKGYVQGAFPYTPEGKIDAEDYSARLSKKNDKEYKIKVQ